MTSSDQCSSVLNATIADRVVELARYEIADDGFEVGALDFGFAIYAASTKSGGRPDAVTYTMLLHEIATCQPSPLAHILRRAATPLMLGNGGPVSALSRSHAATRSPKSKKRCELARAIGPPCSAIVVMNGIQTCARGPPKEGAIQT